jgi:hypothetical protein
VQHPLGFQMETVQIVTQWFLIVAFASYGATCFFSEHLVAEFERYRLPKLRRLTGLLEISGALGLLAGFYYDPLRILSSACLALLMICAVLARIRIRDSVSAMLPAIILLILSIFTTTARYSSGEFYS